MAKRQTKRRRKRYVPGSAYAGHVRPTGVLGFMGSSVVIRVIFVLMALALVGGGFGACWRGQRSSSGNSQTLPLPTDEGTPDATVQPGETETARYAGPPAMSIDPSKRYVATIKTERGDIEVDLLAAQAPQTVNNFVFLARDGFYDGLTFHYVSPGFSAQAGDPTGSGSGGPGYELEQEAPGPFERGALGAINASQFFIALSDSPGDLARYEQYTPFGQVIGGLDVAEGLTMGTEIQTIEIQEQ